MLYKKYHRNYISLFKLGARFTFSNRLEIVDKEPIYSKCSHYIEVRSHYYLWWKLIKSDGKLIKYNVV